MYGHKSFMIIVPAADTLVEGCGEGACAFACAGAEALRDAVECGGDEGVFAIVEKK